MNILLTGGAGYIGSHTCVLLQEMGFSVIIYDNLSNSHLSTLNNIKKISGVSPEFVDGDILDFNLLKATLQKYQITAVVHFAGLKSVQESVENPSLYYRVNIEGTRNLTKAMSACKVHSIIFSSSATVYGDPEFLPITEAHPLKPKNPYGISKLEAEKHLIDLANQDAQWKILSLRYFNPIGAHESGLICENSSSNPSNIMPILLDIALKKRKILEIFGNDYHTDDGTGVRDYIHIMDLAEAHCSALKVMLNSQDMFTGFTALNLGTGFGYSVLNLIDAFHKATNIKIPYQFSKKRDGDIDISFADPALANIKFSWQAKRSLDDMCSSAWNATKQLND